ncbi:DUF2946 domain-containing protein [Paraburkholderia humisilvae]
MCLVVFVPVVSQLVSSATPCSTMHEMKAGTGTHHASDALSACGYCDLLATHAALPPIPTVVEPVLLLSVVAATIVLSTRFVLIGPFPSGRPRDPPTIS